ncbi:NADH dehydrogenase [ubiquinone] 1 beta subcomplex subunit 8, mitochondrial-like isoform X2 [Panonychus citri]|nr:NADH dehydrogenase [ubiquinone] 1 beta subcomplex subunit 8, mitochondrial-like isoform X2 [Panonychus citri]
MRMFKPGPTPKTEEERRAAAAKYNMIPEDYQVWDEKLGWGDYPKFEGVGWDARDPYDDYDCEYDRYWYGEPVHIDSILWGPVGMNPDWVTHKPWYYFYLVSIGTVLGFTFVAFVFEYFNVRVSGRTKPKQFPGANKVHYTFEPAYD